MTFEVREDAVGVGQNDSVAKFGIGESVGNSEVLEDDYGIAVIPEMFVDIVTGVDPSKFAGGSGRIGEEVLRRGFGFGTVDSAADKSKKKRNADVSGANNYVAGAFVLELTLQHSQCQCRMIPVMIMTKQTKEVSKARIFQRVKALFVGGMAAPRQR